MCDALFCRKCGERVDHEAARLERNSNTSENGSARKSASVVPASGSPKGGKTKRRASVTQKTARQCECGNLLMPDAHFCRKCGADAADAAQVTREQMAMLQRGGSQSRSSQSSARRSSLHQGDSF